MILPNVMNSSPSDRPQMDSFEPINQGYDNTFQPNSLSIGLVVPIENYSDGPVPSMMDHLGRVKMVEDLGYKAIWLRDIPLNIPAFGDAGQTFDPFTYLGYLSGHTKSIALGVASIALPLRHPLHVAKSAATVDKLSDGRLILGVASGDRPEEYPAMGVSFDERDQLFRESFDYIRAAQASFPSFEGSQFGSLKGIGDPLPKSYGKRIPLLITGSSRQTLAWNAENADGWMNYPRNLYMQKQNIAEWRDLISEKQPYNKPFMQPLYVILESDDDFKPQGIPLGLRTGIHHLTEYLQYLKEIGVNHVALNMRFNESPIPKALEKIANQVIPQFHL